MKIVISEMYLRGSLKGSMMFIMLLLVILACSAFAQQPGEYKLGPGDSITITTLGRSEFSGEYVILQDGSLNFPGVGLLSITGKNVIDLSKEIEGALAKRLQKPEVYVTLRSQKQPIVYMLGVGASGPLPIQPGWKLSEVMSAAGVSGAGDPADLTITLFRTNGTKDVVQMTDILTKNESKNFPVQGNDMIVVDKIEQFLVYVAGKVGGGGAITVRKDANSLLNVLTTAGGASPDGAVTRIMITHINGESEVVDLTPFLEVGKMDGAPKVRPGDLIVVPESRKRYAVMGWVGSPGFYPMRDNEKLTLSDVLILAGGVEKQRGGSRNIALLRTINGKQERLIYNYLNLITKGDLTQNPVILPGDIVWVPETGAINWDMWVGRLLSTMGTYNTIDNFVTGNRR